MPSVSRPALWAIGLVAVLVLVGAPLAGWPPVLRLPTVLMPALVLAAWVTRPAWASPEFERRAAEWQPSSRLVWSVAVVVGLLLFWFVLSWFRSGHINAVDFTIYYDRPCFQTVHGRPLFVEVSDTPGFSQRSELSDHAYWGMLAVCSVYALHPSPLWLHALSVVAVVLGAVHLLNALQRVGTGGVVASAAALAFVLNDNTARTLNHGFHPEVLYACFVPWMIDCGLRGARKSFLAVTLACVLVKEDACLPIFAVCVGLALNRFGAMSRSERFLFLVVPNIFALGNLALYWGYVMPALSPETHTTFARFWGHYGDTPVSALWRMCSHPRRLLHGTMTSGIFKVLVPHLFLPLIGWRWALGLLPIVVLYGAAADDQIRAFGIYYVIVLVPLLAIASSIGALRVARAIVTKPGHVQVAAGIALFLGALLVGTTRRSYNLRPWKPETAAVPEALARLADEPVVLVQSGLFPHAGYDERVRLLTPETLEDPRNDGVAILLAPQVGAYPFRKVELAALMDLPPIPLGPFQTLAARRSRRR